MNLSLTQKLFVSFLALTALVLAATLGLARWSFERGFLDYVNTLDRGRLERVAVDLVSWHQALGNSWEGFDEAEFERVLARHQPRARPPRPGSRRTIPLKTPDSDQYDAGPGPLGPRTALFDLTGRESPVL